MDNLVTACVDCNLGKSDKDVPFVPETCSGRHIPRIHPLLGRGFLSFKEGKCKEQGVITAVIDDDVGTLLVLQFFEWMGGSTTYQRVIPISRIVFDDASTASGLTYRLFEDNDDRNDYYEWKGGLFEDGAR
ncbi:hypothetical protein SAMN06295987_104304 [Novosphingobium mathurense]|uniref:Uncharacterized protein n=2 Tax=Novosphingobium mathurense TaxID=428990 RepID=A0A1U6I7C1_9SPHN|nr:hypothetical protein SAMN06295987_104304 [Novosphingobium mathurense]